MHSCTLQKADGYTRENNFMHQHDEQNINNKKIGQEKRIAGKKKIGWGKAR